MSYTFYVGCVLDFIEVSGVFFVEQAEKYSERDTGDPIGAVRRLI